MQLAMDDAILTFGGLTVRVCLLACLGRAFLEGRLAPACSDQSGRRQAAGGKRQETREKISPSLSICLFLLRSSSLLFGLARSAVVGVKPPLKNTPGAPALLIPSRPADHHPGPKHAVTSCCFWHVSDASLRSRCFCSASAAASAASSLRPPPSTAARKPSKDDPGTVRC
jgi:hypothetical protein